MKKGKRMRITAWLLAVVVFVMDICGNGATVHAMQVTADDGLQELSEMEQDFAMLLQEYEMYGTLAGNSEIAIFQEPSLDAPVVKMLSSGYQIRFLGAVFAEELWFQIAFGVNDREYTGFVQDVFVVTQDERFAEWKNACFGNGVRTRSAAGLNATQGKTDLSTFPSSYRSYIQKLIAAHPNWTFVPMNTGLKWSDVIENETKDSVNLVDKDSPATWKSMAPDDYDMATGQWIIKNGTTWVQASEALVKYYIDPRNGLNEDYVFQFEQLTYNSSSHTEAGVEKILSGTFMSKKKLEDGSGGNITYAKAFMKIGKELKVSPYFLASRVRQEQGVGGTSALISGTYPGYLGYYNYFNIQATGVGKEQVIISGLQEAQKAGWTTRYAALKGGAEKAANNYIFKGQDTIYLQKFDVDASYNGLYWHQYMQNLLVTKSESTTVRNSYTSMGLINSSFVFKVPVYNDMPAKACPYPGDKLSKPSLEASKSSPGIVKLSWSEIGGAQGYQVYRKEGENGKYTKIKTINNPATVSYQDKTAVPGKVYEYKVRAFLKLSSGNQYSSFSAVQTADCTVPATSWNKFTVSGYTAVQLSWEKADVAGYRIYRKTDSGKYTLIRNVKDGATVSYKDETVLPGHTYTYRIRGYQTAGSKNYYSSYTSVMKAEIKMSAPLLKSAALSGGTKVKLKWEKDSAVSGYYIYRSATKKGGYKRIKTISKNTTATWTDTVEQGNTYYYKIRAYVKTSSGKATSGYSRILMVQAGNKAPAVAEVSSSAAGIKLKWEKNENAAGYQIARAVSYDGEYTILKDVTNNSTVSFTDKKVPLGQTYYYKIRTYQTGVKGTTYSKWSAIAGGEMKLPETQLVGLSKISSKKVTLKWQKVSGVSGYKLYRKTGSKGKYELVHSISGANTVSVKDSGLKSKTTYYYKVCTWKKVNGKICNSAYSGEWCVKTK